ncbi:hypothetical protein [Athalassotoga saccharophila]|uniref:hypothetical protein n=1 Tax=Athalassotoga saccharophila TaxID=1441386 RepID=UPI00137A8C1E|nr:hypothetical protein [Athalassotoga saccharophila]BBJ28660.1 hypothetical protein ATHSA_1579 [Athalassotoga saccharophila]
MSEKTVLAGKILLIASQTIAEISSLLLTWPEEEKHGKQVEETRNDKKPVS